MAPTAPVTALDLGAAAAPVASAPSVGREIAAPATAPAAAPEITGAISATTPTDVAPGCPDGPDCPPEPEGFSDTDKEMLKEFAKCEAEGKSLNTCFLRRSSASLRRRTVHSSRNAWGRAISRPRRSGGAGAWLGQTKIIGAICAFLLGLIQGGKLAWGTPRKPWKDSLSHFFASC
jgi:hypothetical protein